MNSAFDSIMIRVMMGPLMAIMPLFGIYVLVHGHYSPGGGFQAGIVIACTFILPLLVHGKEKWRQVPIFSDDMAIAITSLGVFIFAGVGLIPMLFGSYYMDYSALPLPVADENMRRYYGILIIEVGVTLAVFGGILTIYYMLYNFHGDGEL